MHVIVLRNAEKPEEYHVFDGATLADFPDFVRANCNILVGHNILGFDLPALRIRFPTLGYPSSRVIDTLVVSRLLNFRFEGGHSVENYSKRFRDRTLPTTNKHNIPYPKTLEKVHIDDWSVYNAEVRERCITDTLIQYFIYQYQLRWIGLPAFKEALRTEHYLAEHCRELEDNGFAFNREAATKLREELNGRLTLLDESLLHAFPPKSVLVNSIVCRATKHGTIHAVDFRRLCAAGYNPSDLVVGKEYPIYEEQVFNPGSLKQIIERLNEAGWKPTEKTKGHAEAYKDAKNVDKGRLEHFKEFGWKLSEENLRSLPPTAPAEAQKLVERLLIASRVSDLDEWLGLVTDKGLIHGQFFNIGSWTQRMSTSKPNMQNIPVPQHKDNPSELDKLSDRINSDMRALWTPEVQGNVLVGTDADGIQMRVFAHYVNDERLTTSLIKGDKKNGTDIHSLHWRALGSACKGRQPAKTFIYAWLLGAGVAKVSEILECTFGEAKEAVSNFIEFYPSLKELKDGRIVKDASRGYFKGLDKRLVLCDNTHLMLAGYLQNGEKIIMSTALPIWKTRLIREGVYFTCRNFVHDEWQTETRPDLADYVGRVQSESIREAGERLALNVPLAGNYKVGNNWLMTH